MHIPAEILQQLIDRAYGLAVTVHYEDVPELGAEQPLLDTLCQIKQSFGLEPTAYGPYEDPQLLLGHPLSSQMPQELNGGEKGATPHV